MSAASSAPRRLSVVAALRSAALLAAFLLAACGVVSGGDDEPSAVFEVAGTTATMTGVIGSSTPDAVRDLVDDHPEVETIVMVDVPGSEDDEANLEAGRLVRSAGLATHVPADGFIASGGVDFYLAGVSRTYEAGAEFGVHSWATGDGLSGDSVEDDDAQHDLYLDYYADVGVDDAFYWFTLGAAPADSLHIMSEAELVEFEFGTVVTSDP
ncbi:MAG: alpha/beta hydrolase [Actinomycetota bacterium]